MFLGVAAQGEFLLLQGQDEQFETYGGDETAAPDSHLTNPLL
jgi:hypothetical protein